MVCAECRNGQRSKKLVCQGSTKYVLWATAATGAPNPRRRPMARTTAAVIWRAPPPPPLCRAPPQPPPRAHPAATPLRASPCRASPPPPPLARTPPPPPLARNPAAVLSGAHPRHRRPRAPLPTPAYNPTVYVVFCRNTRRHKYAIYGQVVIH